MAAGAGPPAHRGEPRDDQADAEADGRERQGEHRSPRIHDEGGGDAEGDGCRAGEDWPSQGEQRGGPDRGGEADAEEAALPRLACGDGHDEDGPGEGPEDGGSAEESEDEGSSGRSGGFGLHC